MDSSFDLPDSTDWIDTSLPAFEPLEAALRCEVCKEFYNNPVITSCYHTFCSICIRRCITSDGKCPACKTVCSNDKLIPNIAVREVVMRFQEARPKALELARADKEEETQAGSKKKKRKIDDTDIEENENVRHTRSRKTRSKSQHSGGRMESPDEVADSEDEDDEEFVPDGMVRCPVCNRAMKEELVYNHLDTCTGPDASQGRNTRSKTKPSFPALPTRKTDPRPPPTRLSQLNYTMMKETALRKKLQEMGIPSWGSKDLMKKRHIEWVNIYNSNCDSDDSVRKSHRQLLRELDEWEMTQGGKASNKESKIMKKDFDGEGYARSHKTEFEDLIARARQKRTTPKADSEEQNTPAEEQRTESQNETTANGNNLPHGKTLPNHASPGTHVPFYGAHDPSKDNESAPACLPAKGEAANGTLTTLALKPNDSVESMQHQLDGSNRKVPIYTMPEDPVRDIEGSATVQ